MNPIKNLGGVVKWCMAMVPLAAQTPGPRVTPINETGSATGKIVRVQPFFDSTPPFVEFTLPAADLYRVSNFYFVSEKTEAIKSVYAALLTAILSAISVSEILRSQFCVRSANASLSARQISRSAATP